MTDLRILAGLAFAEDLLRVAAGHQVFLDHLVELDRLNIEGEQAGDEVVVDVGVVGDDDDAVAGPQPLGVQLDALQLADPRHVPGRHVRVVVVDYRAAPREPLDEQLRRGLPQVRDVVIEDTRADGDGLRGRGLQAETGATVRGSRLVIRDAHDVGMITFDAPTRVELVDLVGGEQRRRR